MRGNEEGIAEDELGDLDARNETKTTTGVKTACGVGVRVALVAPCRYFITLL